MTTQQFHKYLIFAIAAAFFASMDIMLPLVLDTNLIAAFKAFPRRESWNLWENVMQFIYLGLGLPVLVGFYTFKWWARGIAFWLTIAAPFLAMLQGPLLISWHSFGLACFAAAQWGIVLGISFYNESISKLYVAPAFLDNLGPQSGE